MTQKIEFIILTWNSEQYITNCLESVFSLGSFMITVHVVDNGSSDNTVSLIKQRFPAVNLMPLPINIGTTRSRNMALSKISASTDFVCILDSDTIINTEAVLRLVDALEQNSSFGVAVPRMCNLQGCPQISYKRYPTLPLKLMKALPLKSFELIGNRMEQYTDRMSGAPYPVDYGISACWMIRKNCLDTVGVLDEAIFYAPEDVDYCLRVWKAGLKVIYVPTAMIIHDTQRISKKKLFSRMNYEHVKGLLYFFHKHGYWFKRPTF